MPSRRCCRCALPCVDVSPARQPHNADAATAMQEAFARGDHLNTVELAQLAQVDLALRLEAPWYSSHAWLQDGRPEDLLGGLYWLGATRCGTRPQKRDTAC